MIKLLPETAPNAINQSRKAVASRVPGSRKGTSTACVPRWYWQLQRNSNQSKADYTPTTLTRYPRERSLADQNVAFQSGRTELTNPSATVNGSQISIKDGINRRTSLLSKRTNSTSCVSWQSVMGPYRSCVARSSQVQNRPKRIVELRL